MVKLQNGLFRHNIAIFMALGFFAVGLFAVGQFAVGQIAVGTPKNIQGLDIFLRIGGP